MEVGKLGHKIQSKDEFKEQLNICFPNSIPLTPTNEAPIVVHCIHQTLFATLARNVVTI